MPATLTDLIERPSGSVHAWADVSLAWSGAEAVYVGSGKRVGLEHPAVVAGAWSITVPLASEVLPVGVVLQVTTTVAERTVVEHVVLPPTSGTWAVASLLAEAPGTVAPIPLLAGMVTGGPPASDTLVGSTGGAP